MEAVAKLTDDQKKSVWTAMCKTSTKGVIDGDEEEDESDAAEEWTEATRDDAIEEAMEATKWDCVCGVCAEPNNEECSGGCNPKKGHSCVCSKCGDDE